MHDQDAGERGGLVDGFHSPSRLPPGGGLDRPRREPELEEEVAVEGTHPAVRSRVVRFYELHIAHFMVLRCSEQGEQAVQEGQGEFAVLL